MKNRKIKPDNHEDRELESRTELANQVSNLDVPEESGIHKYLGLDLG